MHTQNFAPCGTAYSVGTEWQPNFKTYLDRTPVTDHHLFPNLPLNQDESIDKFAYVSHPQITDIISTEFWSSHSDSTSVLHFNTWSCVVLFDCPENVPYLLIYIKENREMTWVCNTVDLVLFKYSCDGNFYRSLCGINYSDEGSTFCAWSLDV